MADVDIQLVQYRQTTLLMSEGERLAVVTPNLGDLSFDLYLLDLSRIRIAKQLNLWVTDNFLKKLLRSRINERKLLTFRKLETGPSREKSGSRGFRY